MRLWAVAIAFIVADAGAQQRSLDLRIPPVTDGVVHSVREVHSTAKGAPRRAPSQQEVGLPSDLDTGPVVGSVVARPFGGQPGEGKWHFGGSGTPEMQSRFAQTGYEVVVTMDDGERRVFRPRDPARFRIGQRVTVRSGELEPT